MNGSSTCLMKKLCFVESRFDGAASLSGYIDDSAISLGITGNRR